MAGATDTDATNTANTNTDSSKTNGDRSMDVSVGSFVQQVKQNLSLIESTTNNTAPSLRPRPLHFILGNPAGDADSIISAIGLAYVESMMYSNSNKGGSDDNDGDANGEDPLRVPIVSIAAEDLKTQRPETTYLLTDCAGINNLDDLIAVDQLKDLVVPYLNLRRRRHQSSSSSSSSSDWNPSTVTLVDHNRHVYATNQDGGDNDDANQRVLGEWIVTEIFDHHLDEGFHLDTCPASSSSSSSPSSLSRRVVAFEESQATVASTCTLVVERFLALIQRNDNDSNNRSSTSSLPPSLAILLLGVILLDSVNMLPQAGKGTARDGAAIELLLKTTNWASLSPPLPPEVKSNDGSGAPNPTKLFETLQAQKYSPKFWKGLTVMQGIRLDYKSFPIEGGLPYSSFGISTILLDMNTFWQKQNLESTFQEFIEENELPFLGLIFTFMEQSDDGGGGGNEDGDAVPRRQLALISTDKELLDRLTSFLTATGTTAGEMLRIDDKTMTSSESEGCQIYMVQMDQRNAAASRKQVAPIFMDFWQQERSRIASKADL